MCIFCAWSCLDSVICLFVLRCISLPSSKTYKATHNLNRTQPLHDHPFQPNAISCPFPCLTTKCRECPHAVFCVTTGSTCCLLRHNWASNLTIFCKARKYANYRFWGVLAYVYMYININICIHTSCSRVQHPRLAPTFTVGSLIYEQCRLLLGLGYMI